MIRPIALAVLLAAPAAAQTTPTPPPPAGDGMDLIERGAGIIFENLLREVQPEMEGMAQGLGEAMAKFGPALDDLAALVDDIRNYQAPERLPNGDILIRRRPEAPPAPPVGEALRDLTRPAPGTPDAPVAPTPPAATAPGASPIPSPAPVPLPTGPQIDL